MKKLYVTLLLNYILFIASAQITWLQKDSFPGAGSFASQAFALNNYAYVVGGSPTFPTATLTPEVWRYDLSNGTWLAKSDFPQSLLPANTFVLDSGAYVIGGYIGGGSYYSGTYLYNSSIDSWTPKASFPEVGVGGSFSFVLNGSGYVGGGTRNGASHPSATMYAYDPSGDSWAAKANYPGPLSQGMVGFAINGYGYAGSGSDGNYNFYSQFYKYDPGSDSWSAIAPFPGYARANMTAVVLNGKAYVGAGWSNYGGSGGCTIDFSDFYAYDPTTNQWTGVSGMIGPSSSSSSFFAYNNIGYIVGGACHINDGLLHSVFEFGECQDLAAALPPNPGNQQMEIQAYPNPASGDMNIKLSGWAGNEVQYRVFGVDGQLVIQGSSLQDHFSLGTGKLQDAIYELQIKDNMGAQGTKRLIVIR